MGTFNEFPDEKPLWDLRERIKQMFPFVKTVKFQRNLMKLETTIGLETLDGQLIAMVFSDETFHSKYYAPDLILETLKSAVAAQYEAPNPDYIKKALDFDYKKLEADLLKNYQMPKPIFESTDHLTEQIKKLTVDQIMKDYSNIVLNEEQKKIVQQKTYEYFLSKQYKIPTNSWSTGGSVASELSRLVPDLYAPIKCPRCDTYRPSYDLKTVIIHLNDTHKMSREYIADWLESTDLDLEFKVEEVTK